MRGAAGPDAELVFSFCVGGVAAAEHPGVFDGGVFFRPFERTACAEVDFDGKRDLVGTGGFDA